MDTVVIIFHRQIFFWMQRMDEKIQERSAKRSVSNSDLNYQGNGTVASKPEQRNESNRRL